MQYITVYTDGSGDGHSIAVLPNGKFYVYYEEGATNNAAEYNGVIMAIMSVDPGVYLTVRCDSQLVCGHLGKDWKINHEHLLEKFNTVRELQEAKEIRLILDWIPRKQNIADTMLRRYLKRERAERRMD